MGRHNPIGDAMKKADMKCGKVYKSDRPGKKVMQKVCKDGKEKKIHAGDSAS